MTLRKRLFWLFAPLLLFALGFAYLLSQSLILSRFDRQDTAQLTAEAERLRALLDNSLKRNLDLLLSYAQWDDSYEFMRGNHPDFTRRNMDPDALRQMNFDFMVFLDLDGEVRAEQWLPPDLPDLLVLGSDRPSSHASLRRNILALAERLRQSTSGGPRGQLVEVQGVPLILVMSEISNNQNSLPSVGTLLAGHFIDGERAEHLQTQLNGALRLLPPSDMLARWRDLPATGLGQEDGDGLAAFAVQAALAGQLEHHFRLTQAVAEQQGNLLVLVVEHPPGADLDLVDAARVYAGQVAPTGQNVARWQQAQGTIELGL